MKPPKTVNFAPYDFCFADTRRPPWCMDKRHIQALHDLAMRVPFGGIAVEIGSHKGASTAAFVEAINAGRSFQLHLVDPEPTPELMRVIGMCAAPGLIVLHQMKSENFRLPRADLWFIDGDHGWPALADLANALVSQAKVIAIHDHRDVKGCPGSYLAAEALQAHHGRVWDEDVVDRPGEWTWRGFGVSTKR